MANEIIEPKTIEHLYSDISNMIASTKQDVMLQVNKSVISLYWNIGKKLCEEVLIDGKATYGKNIIGDLSKRLSDEYGKGFDKSAVFKMV